MANEKNEFNPFGEQRPLTTADLPAIAEYVKGQSKSSSPSRSRSSSASRSKSKSGSKSK